jgi:periplasmic protein CpxP/Spy
MKKLIAVLSLGMLVAGSAYAQTTTTQKDQKARSEQRAAKGDRAQKSPEDMAKMRTEKLAQKLDMNASQKNQLQALNMRHAEEMKAMRESYKTTGEKTAEDKAKMKEAKQASHDKRQAELKGILTPQQFAKYEAEKSEMKARHGEHKEGYKGKGTRSGEYKQQSR